MIIGNSKSFHLGAQSTFNPNQFGAQGTFKVSPQKKAVVVVLPGLLVLGFHLHTGTMGRGDSYQTAIDLHLRRFFFFFASTRDSFVDSGTVHELVLFMALGTPLFAPLCMVQSRLGNIWFPPEPPVLPFNIQYRYWYCQHV